MIRYFHANGYSYFVFFALFIKQNQRFCLLFCKFFFVILEFTIHVEAAVKLHAKNG